MSALFVAGLDLGQARDYSALAILQASPTTHQVVVNEHDQDYGLPCEREATVEGPPIVLALRWLERYPLGTPYPDVVREVSRRLDTLPGPALLALDFTGVGRPVADLFRATGRPLIAITISGGANVSGEAGEWTVPKRDLVHGLLVALQQGRFSAAARLQLAPVLIQELTRFELKLNAQTGHDSYESWREGVHDDLVLACAIAAWTAEQESEARYQQALQQLELRAAMSAPGMRISPY